MGEPANVSAAAILPDVGRSMSAAAVFVGSISAVLAMGMTAVLDHSLSQADWASGSRAHTWALWLGLLCGAALAASRFHGRIALGYSALLSFAVAAEIVGRVLPSASLLVSAPVGDVIWAAHVHLWALAYRLNGWWATFTNGEAIQDTGLFVFVLTLAAWHASAWLAWCTARRRGAFLGLLPSSLILAANTHLSGQSPMALWLFIVGASLLLARTAFTWQRREWDGRHVDYPDELGADWAGSALLLTLAISLAAVAAPWVGTPQGWQLLADFVGRSRQQTAQAAERLFSGVKPPRLDQPVLTARTPMLEVIGAPPDSSQATVMWVQISDPAPGPPEGARSHLAPPQHYWRSTLFTQYTGRGWETLAAGASQAKVSDLSLPQRWEGRYALHQQFEIVASHADTLFGANMPVSAGQGALISYWPPDETALLKGPASRYEVTSWAANVTEAQLRAAPPDYPAAIVATYLQLPESLPRRVRDLAARITRGAVTGYDKAVRLQTYLRTTYPYALDVPAPPPGRDAVDYFLFEAPGGFCSYYASAMAVMLRAEGVPARVASGYAMGEYDARRRAYRVPGAAAHAWVEVYFHSYGWVEFEPTAGRAVFGYQAGAVQGPGTPALLPSAPPAFARWETLAWGVGMVALLGSAALVWRLVAPREQSRARALYRRMRWVLGCAGLSGSASLTPDEFLAAHALVLAGRPALREAARHATALFVQATFSRHPVPPQETQTAEWLWRRAAPEWLALWMANGASRIASGLGRPGPRGPLPW